MTGDLWRFTDKQASFESLNAQEFKDLYFPLCNETLLSCVTPTLHGDIKTDQDSFLLIPVSRQDLVNLRSSRNFWVYFRKNKVWSATGVSKDLKQIQQDLRGFGSQPVWQVISPDLRCGKAVG